MAKHTDVDCENCVTRDRGIFCSLKKLQLRELCRNKSSNRYKKGQTIFYQGNPPLGLHCVHSGKIKLSQFDTGGKESLIRIVQQGDILGHRSLFCHQNYNNTAMAIEDSVICFIDKKKIFEIAQQHSSVAMNIIAQLGREMGMAEKRISSICQKNVKERIAEILLWLRASYGIEQKDGRIKLNIILTRDELASIAGTAVETVIRFISDFKDQGIIEQDGKTIYIVAEEKLIGFANLNKTS